MNWIFKKAIFMYEDTKYIIEFDGNKRSFDPFLRGFKLNPTNQVPISFDFFVSVYT